MRKGRKQHKKYAKAVRGILRRSVKILRQTTRWIRANRLRRRLATFALVALALFLWNSVELPPTRSDNLCAIFFEKPSWYRILRSSALEFGVPEAVQMAILHQESGFRATARPPRRKILWILPGPRPSTAFGYAQALDSTWEEYRQRTNRPRARRDRFQDAAHFTGWYLHEVHRLTGIERDDTYRLYLAYHEGPAGFRRGTHQGKPWLLDVARRVARRATSYQQQLEGCRDRLEGFPWRRVLWFLLLVALLLVGSRWTGTWPWEKTRPRWKRRRRKKR